MSKSKLFVGAVCLSGLIVGVAYAGIPTVEERVRNSSLNPEYYEPWQNWHASYRRLPPVDKGASVPMACYRNDFTLSDVPRVGWMSFYIPHWQGGYTVALNGRVLTELDVLLQPPFRSLEITPYLRSERNVLTITGSGTENAHIAVEGIVFGEDGQILRVMTDLIAHLPWEGGAEAWRGPEEDRVWRGGWNLPEGWDDPARDPSDLPVVTAPRVRGPGSGRPRTLPQLPYYGPIRIEALDARGQTMREPIFDAEAGVDMSITLLNMRGQDDLMLQADIFDEFTQEIIGARTVELQPSGKLDMAGGMQLRDLSRGSYQVRFSLMQGEEKLDWRRYELAVVGEIQQRIVSGTHYEDGLDLREICRIDCTDEPAPGTFIASIAGRSGDNWEAVDTHVVQGPAGHYRSLTDNHNQYQFGYRFKVENLFVPHLVVIEWPDDARRGFIAHVIEGSTMIEHSRDAAMRRAPHTGFQRSEASVFTRDDLHPERSNKMQKLHLLYWPNEKEAAVHITNIGGAEAPAAAARITVYEITNDLPALNFADYGDRLIGPHTERGVTTMPSIYYSGPLGALFRLDFLYRQHPEFYRNWMTATENFIKRMRFSGQNLYLMGHLAYEGTLFPTSRYFYTQDVAAGGDVHGDYTALMLRMFEHNDMSMISSVQHFGSPKFWRNVSTIEEVREGAPTHLVVDWRGEFVPLHGFPDKPAPNYLHPDIQEGVLGIVEELAGLYGDSPAWKGVAFVLSSSVWGPMAIKRFWDVRADPLHCGLEDWTVAEFERDTGISIPVELGDPTRFERRYHWLMDNARQAWIDWRADRFTQLYRAMRDRLQAVRPDLNLYLCSFEPGLGRTDKAARDLEGRYDDSDYIRTLLKTYGFDLAALQAEPGIVFSYSYQMLGSGVAGGGQPGAREVQFNQTFQNVMANDAKSGAWIWGGLPHYGAILAPENKWLFTRNATRQGYFYSTYVNESSVNVMARSNPTWMPHDWADVSDSIGRLHERRLFARAYRTLPNGKYERLTGNGLDRNIWVSRTVKDGAEYVYAANLQWWELDVTLTFASGSRVHNLIGDHPVDLVENTWQFRLPPYSIQTFRIERSGFLRRLRGASALESGSAEIELQGMEQIETTVENEIMTTRLLIEGTRARLTEDPEIVEYPGWRGMAYLERNLANLEKLRDAERWSDAYTLASAGGLAVTRDLLVDEALQAMPFLVVGAFGEPDDTDFVKFGLANPEVVSDWRGMKIPFIGERNDPEDINLREEFRPNPQSVHEIYGGRKVGWHRALKTSTLYLPPFGVNDTMLERLAELQQLGPTRHRQARLLSSFAGHVWLTSYAYSEIYSPEKREVQLAVGSPHAIWVWVNDNQVVRHGGGGTHRGGQRPQQPGQDIGSALFKKGWNRLLMKIGVRAAREIDVHFSVADNKGNALTDLRYRVPHMNNK